MRRVFRDHRLQKDILLSRLENQPLIVGAAVLNHTPHFHS
jgi:hypothetical protein